MEKSWTWLVWWHDGCLSIFTLVLLLFLALTLRGNHLPLPTQPKITYKQLLGNYEETCHATKPTSPKPFLTIFSLKTSQSYENVVDALLKYLFSETIQEFAVGQLVEILKLESCFGLFIRLSEDNIKYMNTKLKMVFR